MTADLVSVRAPGAIRYGLQDIRAAFDRSAILGAVRQAFVDHCNGRFVNARPTHLTFPDGDCHIKCGYTLDGDTITIKVATGFYNNEKRGLPNASGFVFVLDQQTGLPLALLEDAGWLTAWRTVAASVIAVQVRPMAARPRIGIVGAGLQAELAAEWLAATVNPACQRIWARSAAKAEALAARIGAETRAESDLATLCRTSSVIVTATPAEQPLIMAEWVQPGTHIVALGADTPGKVEIDAELFGRAATIITDDHDQCTEHGDFGVAVRAGIVGADADIALGRVLSGEAIISADEQAITIADLTGLAAQDDAIARLFLTRLPKSETAA